MLSGGTHLSSHPKDEIHSRFPFLEAKESKTFVMQGGVFHVGLLHADLLVQVYFLTSRYDPNQSTPCPWQNYAVTTL